MLITIPALLSAAELQAFRATLAAVDWSDGRGSAGYLSAQVKRNRQLPDEHPVARRLGEQVLRALQGSALFTAAALPARILPPLFNCYGVGETYGRHVDGAIRPVSGTPHRVRSDLSATLFLSDPASYDGGELEIDDAFGRRQVKLAAGDLLLYPGSSVHQVLPVTRGERLASFFWIQSLVRDDHKRTLLFQLDSAIQRVSAEAGPASAAGPATELAGVYHNLLRLWAEL
jgi:PKHD-type hydroxylase